MEYSINIQPDICTIVLKGSFTLFDNISFNSIISQLEENITCIILDMNNVEFIDSAALGMLLLMREENKKHHKKIILRHARGQVRKMFDLSKMETLFTVES